MSRPGVATTAFHHKLQDLAASFGIELLSLPSYSSNLNLIERL